MLGVGLLKVILEITVSIEVLLAVTMGAMGKMEAILEVRTWKVIMELLEKVGVVTVAETRVEIE